MVTMLVRREWPAQAQFFSRGHFSVWVVIQLSKTSHVSWSVRFVLDNASQCLELMSSTSVCACRSEEVGVWSGAEVCVLFCFGTVILGCSCLLSREGHDERQ